MISSPKISDQVSPSSWQKPKFHQKVSKETTYVQVAEVVNVVKSDFAFDSHWKLRNEKGIKQAIDSC